MRRSRKYRALTVQQRVKMCRERARKRREQNERINTILQQEDDQNLNQSELLDESVVDNETKLRDELCDWANSYHISKRAINSLLFILHSNGIKHLPKNYRTLQRTPLNVEIANIAGGRFWYNGIGKCMKKMFSTLSKDLRITLKFNVDGLPLYKSSKICFWPILASIFGRFLNLILSHESYAQKIKLKLKKIHRNAAREAYGRGHMVG